MSVTSVSDRKAQANRLNARKSTGPRTVEGKARSSQNATTLGLFARQLLLPDEDATQLEALRQGMIDSLKPADALEAMLVERIVAATWKLQRLAGAEETLYELQAQALDSCLERQLRQKLSLTPKEHVQVARGTYAWVGPPLPSQVITALLTQREDALLMKLAAHEQRLENSIHRCLRQLRQLRKDRGAEPEADDPVEINEPPASQAVTEGTAQPANLQSEPTVAPATSRACASGQRETDQSGPICTVQKPVARISKTEPTDDENKLLLAPRGPCDKLSSC